MPELKPREEQHQECVWDKALGDKNAAKEQTFKFRKGDSSCQQTPGCLSDFGMFWDGCPLLALDQTVRASSSLPILCLSTLRSPLKGEKVHFSGAPGAHSTRAPYSGKDKYSRNDKNKQKNVSAFLSHFHSPGSTGTAIVSRVKGLFTMSLDLAAKLSALKVSK